MKELRRSIVQIMALLVFFQLAAGITLGWPAGRRGLIWFAVGTIAYHLGIGFGLLRLERYWVLTSTGTRLHRVNAANGVTLYRLSGIPAGVFLLIALPLGGWREWAVFTFVTSVFLSDFVDGKISRWGNQVTEVGKILDSTSDYMVLAAISVVFSVRSMIPIWFLVVFLTRMALQTYFATHLSLLRKGIKAEATWVGKTAVASIMILFAVVTASLVPALSFLKGRTTYWLVIVCAVLQGVTAVDKTLWFLRTRREILSNR